MGKSGSSDGSMVRYFREKLGWSREKLAAKAKRSVRVLAKVETGESVRQQTIEAVVAVFQQEGIAVTLADLMMNPEALARRFLANYAKYQADCISHSLDLLSPDIVANVDGDPATNPIAGEYRGIEEFDRFFKTFFTIFVRDSGELGESVQMTVNGNDVIAWGLEYIRIPEVPPQKGGFVMLHMRFEEGRMVRFNDHYEVSGMMHALKNWAEEYPDASWLNHVEEDAIRAWTSDDDLQGNAS